MSLTLLNRMATLWSPSQAHGTLVIQPLPGIGDQLWHLPHLQAIAQQSSDTKISLLTKPRSLSKQWLYADPSIQHIIWVERNPGKHDGILGMFRLVKLLKQYQFRQVWILHNSSRYPFICWLAGIPIRFSYGKKGQKLFSQGPFLDQKELQQHPIDKANSFLKRHQITLKTADFPFSKNADATINERFSPLPKPWIGIGLGSSEAYKQWGQARFTGLIKQLTEKKIQCFLFAGPDEQTMAELITQQVATKYCHNQACMPLDQVASLLAQCLLYVGNDTGILNLSAAVGTKSIGLFGASPKLSHLTEIICLTPQISSEKMQGITIEQVLQEIEKIV